MLKGFLFGEDHASMGGGIADGHLNSWGELTEPVLHGLNVPIIRVPRPTEARSSGGWVVG